MSDKYRRGAVVAICIYGLQAVPILLSELPLLEPGQRLEYAIVRGALILTTPILARWIWKDYRAPAANVAAMLHTMVYSIHGQWYRPLYYISFMQLATAMALLFAVPARTFVLLLGAWTIAMGVVMRLRWEELVRASQHPVYSDLVFVIFSVAIVTYIVHRYFTSERLFRDRALSRFSHIGLQSSRLIHDLKSLTAAPKLYSQLLRERLKDSSDPVVLEAITSLGHDLENLGRVVLELNQISAVKTNVGVAEFGMDEVLSAVQILLGGRLRFVSLELEVTMRLRNSDRSLLISMFLNLFLNSIDVARERKIADPRIRIIREGNTVLYSDNGGGFEDSLLKGLTDGTYLSTKDTGSGLGTFLVLDGMRSMGGRARFFNQAGCACVALEFPNRSVAG